ncbi:tail fiber assembly protein [Xenorhabdus cabanillasii]|uniref:Putaive tail fiber assembly protein n=1 Tax=Xenorhabdus cabanillasii JM26 TaxID=1427517 RepID=W1JA15_9GAMM|nr:tail fiber assembly protein [Xenorhabdus cabanillasii]PHM77921.1 tail fiber assembly protein [Xenorhabdus cabanillasii JM26]CDL86731.1 Putaive tail fiber assembly protein [Xenorhabdus cabanillasii JM26]
MNYFLDKKTRQIYAYEDGVDRRGIISGLTPVSEAEALAIANPPPTPEQQQEQAESQKRYRLSQASNSIAPLQYAVDLKMATDRERDSLTEWKKYCVLLNRVDCSAAPDIDWPEVPE